METVREGAGDLTLRTGEFDTLKACINVDHIDENFLGPPLVDADWDAFCQAIYKGVEGNEWGELYHHYREMSKSAGAKKPSESQKAKALSAMKAAKDRGDEFYDLARKDNILGRNQTRLELWEENLKDPLRGESVSRLIVGSGLVTSRFHDLRPRGFRFGARVVGQTVVAKGLALSGHVGLCASARSLHALERARKVWAARRALFLPCQKEAGGGFK